MERHASSVARARPRPSGGELLRLAWPLMLAQMAFLGMSAVDTWVAGQYSAITLAGVGLGASVTMVGFSLLLGIGLAVAPAVSRQIGAGTPQARIGAWVRGALTRSIWLWTGLMLLLQLLAGPLARAIAPEPAVATELAAYLRWATLGYPLVGVFFVLRNVIEAHSISRPVMVWGLAALGLNLPLDLAFVYGWGPLPEMGAAGCGLATSLIHALLGLGLLATLRLHPATRRLPLAAGAESPSGAREMLRQGLPIGLALVAETGLFALGGLLMARYGTAALGAHHIVVTLSALGFMLQVGIGQATAVLIGRALGRGHAAELRAAAVAGLRLCLALALVVALIYGGLGRLLIAQFSRDVEVQAIGAAFMGWAALFHVFDALQALHAAALRGVRDTAAVMRRTLCAYMLVGAPLMLLLTLAGQPADRAIWGPITLALAVAAALLMHRFWPRLDQVLPPNPDPHPKPEPRP